ncbi:protein phosphatase 1 regulatory subunit 3C-B-like [Sceloporus undulatus]|uniref:protein phosphatase 1 regulatory subunit 3C-B-like n=1 Tax=Sceloporus undulatus TaxID=8520 RepID=UPI001C4D5E19|nr:protein phosphatase 1 regulatory subunit 3C-B-like [Sceloporus undulatus]
MEESHPDLFSLSGEAFPNRLLMPSSAFSLFQVFGTRAIAPRATPIDLARRLCLSHPPPIRKLLDSYEELREGLGHQPLRPCLNNKFSVEPERQPDTAKGCRSKKKKRVVFADMKGFSLTAVRIFSKIEEDLCDLQQALSHLTNFRNKLRGSRPEPRKYMLDFPQPSADYMAFRSRLQSGFVCLENCLIQEKSISGTVKVINISYEKEVYIRITFDSWRRFCDIGCQYMPNTYGYTDTDTFSFEVPLPKGPAPCDTIEFCISFHCGQKVYWDNNHGKNYIIRQAMGPSPPSALSRLGKGTLTNGEPLGTSRAAALVLSRLQTWRRSEIQTYW